MLLERITRIGEMYWLTVQQNLARGRLLRSGENVHERCLTSSVLSDETMYFATVNLEINVIDCHHAGERLDDATSCQHRFGHWRVRLHSAVPAG